MEAIFKAWTTSRNLYLRFFEEYSLEQLNKIPEGFSNNLIWNIGHVIVAQQSLVYRGSNQPMKISDELLNRYKPGTHPQGPVSETELAELKGLLISLIESTIEDYKNGIFTTYNERTTGTGFHLASVQDAFEFNNYHEGIHLGYMMSIRKFV